MTLQSLPGILVAALLAVLAPNIAHTNLVSNPGFETGNFSGWIQFGNVGFTGVDGLPHSGSFSAFLGPVGSCGFLSQTLAMTPGQRYNLGFFLQNDGFTPNEFQVTWNGSVISDQFNLPAFGYTERDFLNLLATSPTTPLVFGFRNDPGFLHLDDIAVTSPGANHHAPSWHHDGGIGTRSEETAQVAVETS